MTDIKTDSRQSFYSELDKRLKTLGKNGVRFGRLYYSQTPLSEIAPRGWQAVTGSVRSAWRFYQRFDGTQPLVRVFNSEESQENPAERQTIIEVVAPNMPFLLDSIRMVLNDRKLMLSEVQQCLLSVVRTGGKVLLLDDQQPNETLIHLETERQAEIGGLEEQIRELLKLIGQVVADFAPMRQQLLLWGDEIGAGPGASDADTESYEFLSWLYTNNFTFLGYEAYTSGKRGLKRADKESLGLCRTGLGLDQVPLEYEPDGLLRVQVTKLPIRSQVHRKAYLDQVVVNRTDTRGNLRVCRFIGLFTSAVYSHDPMEIPLVRQNIAAIFKASEMNLSSQKGRELARIIEVLPRDELLLATRQELADTVMSAFALQERRVVRLLVRASAHFVSCLVYVPRDVYDTALRRKVQQLLSEHLMPLDTEFSTLFSESSLIRTHFVFRVSPDQAVNLDVPALEARIQEFARSWTEDFRDCLLDQYGDRQGGQLFERYGHIFPAGYQDDFSPSKACADVEYIEQLSAAEPLILNLYIHNKEDVEEVHFKLFHQDLALPLSDVLPILENLGARCIEEHPYELRQNGHRIWVHDFVLTFTSPPEGGLACVKPLFEEAFREVWHCGKENDAFNRLVPAACMNYRQVKVIRAYGRYFGQLQSSYSQAFIADCVVHYADISRLLFDLFDVRFNPENSLVQEQKRQEAVLRKLWAAIDEVENLAEDRVLRRYVEMILATVRVNFYQRKADGSLKDCLSFKLKPSMIPEIPRPVPAFEIFVYSARVEGVHLRGGKVARGGLRWSDRQEDYRTEVLGLVKAQQVKNSVIVPVGAKGGFLPKQIPPHASREEIQAEGIACYRIFIQGLLDLTDNLVNGEVVHPEAVQIHDEDDYYLVVAADKGTAAFSDIANELAIENNFWLGDAFASGGSVGYDHKAMGITAKGAWISVQQHFRDLGVDIQQQDFTVTGIGDMSGDVFGNGMLLSEHICLVAAFNHLHIFIDPDPDAGKSFRERQRLFALPRSTWDDYNRKLISKGGGVFSRSAKAIAISAEMKTRFGIAENSLTPNQLITAILQAEVDLLWNGGIGTYVKSRKESNLDVGDKSNDAIRINGAELRAKVVGEGGNLGMTQLARVEYNLHGGICFTDFIDNAGGVNCSDVEVNIKILLNQLLESGDLTAAARKKLLYDMTDAVGEIVLANNYMQVQGIKLLQYQSKRRNAEYLRLLSNLEDQGRLDRQLEFLPTDEELQERKNKGQYLTYPELSVLTSYVKGLLKEQLSASEVLDDPYLLKEMYVAFPARLTGKYADSLTTHRLRRELIATQIANRMVSHMGINFVDRISESTGVTAAEVARAYVAARDIFGLEDKWHEVELLDHKVSHSVQKAMLIDLSRLVRRVSRWLIRNRRRGLDLAVEVPRFQTALLALTDNWSDLLTGTELEAWQQASLRLTEAGVPSKLAGFVAAAHNMYAVMGIVEASDRVSQPVDRVAEVYFMIGERLHLHWFSFQINQFQARNQWQALARETFQDDLHWQQLAISLAVLREGGKRKPTAQLVEQWLDQHQSMVSRWLSLQSEMTMGEGPDASVFAVANRELLDLAQSSATTDRKFA
ncbi:MAG: NAD-glutamate dehydrogenase [Pseudomonadales bacterium]|nr:NAD-glutamate dehydrogenase [Pseudomonadales bacterium]